MLSEDITELLNPILQAAAQGKWTRVVIEAHRVVGERADERRLLAVDWSAAQHQAALEAVYNDAALFAQGLSVVGETLVLWRGPEASWPMLTLCERGMLSEMSARFLSAAVQLGRNVLVVGPQLMAVQLVASLVGEGERPGLLSRDINSVPPTGWLDLSQNEDVSVAGADRIAAWSLSWDEIVVAMSGMSGLVAWADGRRLDRALMRFEASIERSFGKVSTPLHVLSGLDLVVVVGDVPGSGPRVLDIAEIVLSESGYRPQLLFSSGLPPMPRALVPVALPSFAAELSRFGSDALVSDWQSVLQSFVVAPSRERAVAPVAEPVRSARPFAPGPTKRAAKSNFETPMPDVENWRAATTNPDAAPPGWELDLIDANEIARESEAARLSYEDADLAASYGLAPPPRPPIRITSDDDIDDAE